MKLDINFDFDIDFDSVQKVLNNPDVKKFYLWMLDIHTLCGIYKDKKSLDLVFKICNTIGYMPKYLTIKKRTYKELKKFYDKIIPDLNNYDKFPDITNLKDEPDDDSESEESEEEAENVEINNELVYDGRKFEFDTKSIDDANSTDVVQELREVIRDSKAFHEELKTKN